MACLFLLSMSKKLTRVIVLAIKIYPQMSLTKKMLQVKTVKEKALNQKKI